MTDSFYKVHPISFDSLCEIECKLAFQNLILHQRFYDRVPGAVAAGGSAVMGFCGHHFIGDGTNHWESQFTGELNLTEQGLSAWLRLIEKRNGIAKSFGLKIIHLFAPEKQSVLSEFRWLDLPPKSACRPMHRLIEALQVDADTVLYPADLLRAHAGSSELYWRGNSHWCTSSVCLVAEALTQRFLDADLPASSLALKRSAVRHDLLIHFQPDCPYEEIIRIAPLGTLKQLELSNTQKRHTGSSRHIKNPNSAGDGVLVIFCDSYVFDCGLDYALSYRFREVYVQWQKEISWEYVRSVQGTHVLWECAERFLGRIPDAEQELGTK